MIPNTKISQTILEFGKDLILTLPPNHSKEELEAVMKTVITTWNVVVFDSWDKGNKFETEYLKIMMCSPKPMQLEVKRLIKRKKTKFSSDPRAVGKYWVKEHNKEYTFVCEALLDVKKVQPDGTLH